MSLAQLEQVYAAACRREPAAVSYLNNVKVRIEEGKRAQVVYDALKAIHERRKGMSRSVIGYVGEDYPPGSYITPNGKVLTPQVIGQLITMIRQALGGTTDRMVAAPAPAPAPAPIASPTQTVAAKQTASTILQKSGTVTDFLRTQRATSYPVSYITR